jgi:hypothetical protein
VLPTLYPSWQTTHSLLTRQHTMSQLPLLTHPAWDPSHAQLGSLRLQQCYPTRYSVRMERR